MGAYKGVNIEVAFSPLLNILLIHNALIVGGKKVSASEQKSPSMSALLTELTLRDRQKSPCMSALAIASGDSPSDLFTDFVGV